MAKNRNSKTLVGLDIEPGYIAAAEVRVNGKVAVERAATMSLQPGVVRDGEVTDPEALAEALKGFFKQHSFGKRVRIGVANQRIVVRTLDVPPLENAKELAAAVRFQAQDQLPMPLDQAVLDYHSLGVVDTPEGRRTRVIVVAARRDMIERLLAAVSAAGLRVEGIDLSAFAMIRALGHNLAPAGSGATLYVNVGGLTNLAVAERGVCRFTRVAASGVEAMVAQLAERAGLTLEHARMWLGHVGLVKPLDGIEGDQRVVQHARTVLSDGAQRIGDEIRNSLNFYRMQDGAEQVDHVVLTGPAIALEGFAESLGEQLGLPVTTGLVEHGANANDVEWGRMTVAAGLAVAEVKA